MSNSLIENDLRTILATEDGNYVAQYEQVVAELDKTAVVATRNSREMRKESWKKAVAKLDRKQLAKANRTFKGYLGLVRRNAELSAIEVPTVLNEIQAANLMEEALSLRDAQELLKGRWEEIKRLVFGSMTEQFSAEGEEFPDQVAGSIDIPELGFRFSREGCGRKDPELNEEALAGFLGTEVWDKVTIETIIPAQIVRKVNFEALMREARKDPSILEALRKSLKVGEWKTSRFNVRELQKKE
jgi:hypothetical protein